MSRRVKKNEFLTTILQVAAGGMAAADVPVSGSAETGANGANGEDAKSRKDIDSIAARLMRKIPVLHIVTVLEAGARPASLSNADTSIRAAGPARCSAAVPGVIVGPDVTPVTDHRALHARTGRPMSWFTDATGSSSSRSTMRHPGTTRCSSSRMERHLIDSATSATSSPAARKRPRLP